MRVLRDLSYRRLSALEMHAPSTLLLSCVTTGFYPDDEADICRYIVDLDEHSVRWVECVRNMWQRDGIRHFLELGPQDTLCGLVTENEPRALCMASSARGHECENMRCTLAKLFSLGHLSYDAVRNSWRKTVPFGRGGIAVRGSLFRRASGIRGIQPDGKGNPRASGEGVGPRPFRNQTGHGSAL